MILIALDQVDVGMLVTIANIYQNHRNNFIGLLEKTSVRKVCDGEIIYVLGHGSKGMFNSGSQFGEDLADLLIANGLKESRAKVIQIKMVSCHSAEEGQLQGQVFDSVAKGLWKRLEDQKINSSVTGFLGPAVTDDLGVTRGKRDGADATAYDKAIAEFKKNGCSKEWDCRAATIRKHLESLPADIDPQTAHSYLVTVSQALKEDTRLMFKKLYAANKGMVHDDVLASGGAVRFPAVAKPR